MAPDASPEFLLTNLERIKKALNCEKRLDMYEMGHLVCPASSSPKSTDLAIVM